MAQTAKTLAQRVERLEKIVEDMGRTRREHRMNLDIIESVLVGLIRRHGLTMDDMAGELARVRQEVGSMPPGVLELALERLFQLADRGRRGH